MKNRKAKFVLFLHIVHLLILIVLNLTNNSFADAWSQWLGNQRDGIWRESGLIKSFPEKRLKPVWQTPIGGGYTGPAVAGGLVFVMDRIKHDPELKKGQFLHQGEIPENTNFVRRLLTGSERVLALDQKNGHVIWSHEYNCSYRSVALYAIGPRATPTVDCDHVYTLGAEGNLFCFKAKTGQIVWQRNLREDYRVQTPEWGFAAHPLVDGKRLICMVGGDDTTVVALDKLSGQEIWRSGSTKQPGYCAPVIYQLGGKRQLVVWDSHYLRGLNPESGQAYWQIKIKPTFAMSIGIPQQVGNRLFVMAYSKVSALIEVAKDGNSAEIVWRGDAKRGIGGVFNSAVILDGHVYACGQSGSYTCVELVSGRRLWETFEPSTGGRPANWANVFTVRSDELFWLFNDSGEVMIADMSPQGFRLISKTKLIEPTHRIGRRTVVWSHPALANRHIFIRNDQKIACYNVSAVTSE